MGKSNRKKNQKTKVASKPKPVEKVQPEATTTVEEQKATVGGADEGKKDAIGRTGTTTTTTSITPTTITTHVAKGTSKPCSSSNSATAVITTKGGSIPDGYVGTGEEDVFKYSDISHTSVIKKVHGYFKGTFRGSHIAASKAFTSLNHKVITTSCEVDPVIKILEVGVDLAEAHNKPWCCFGTRSWNCRHYAHELSNNFSSVVLCAEEEEHVEKSDFISDWSNIKALFKSHGSESHMSFFLHKVGNAVAIDQLDLTSAMLVPDFAELPTEFKTFIEKVLGGVTDKTHKVVKEGKSDQSALAKEAFHRFLHAIMGIEMEVNFSKRKVTHPSTKQFLHHVILNSDKFQFLVGSDMPVFKTSETSPDPLNPEMVTARSVDRPNMNTLDALDLWLDNALMDCSRSLVSHHKDWKITKTHYVDTNDLPNIGKFDPTNYMEHGEKLLSFIQKSVKPGSSYWLYRAPGSFDITIYNISSIAKQLGKGNQASTTGPIFDKWPLLTPYLPYFGMTALTKYSECLCEVIGKKLEAETEYVPREGAAVMAEIMSKINNNQLPNSSKNFAAAASQFPGITNGPTHPSKNHKKLYEKLEQHSKALRKYVPPPSSEDGGGSTWMICSAEDISAKSFTLILNCIKGIYTTAIALTPNMRKYLYGHAVKRYAPLCSKLVNAIGPSKERMKDWDVNFRLREFLVGFTEGLCGLLRCLIGWHSYDAPYDIGPGVKNASPGFKEWQYRLCQMNIYYGDTLGKLTVKVYEKLRVRLPPDAALPSGESHRMILNAFQSALDVMGSEKSVSFDKEPAITREQVVRKLAMAYLSYARFQLSFPSFLHHVIGSPTLEPENMRHPLYDGTSTTYFPKPETKLDPSATAAPNDVTKMRIKACYEEVCKLLEVSIHFADMASKDDELMKRIKLLANSLMGELKVRGFELKNVPLSEFCKFGDNAAAEILACLETGERGLEGLGKGSGNDHFKTAEHVYKDQAVSEAPVVLVRNFANGEAISEAITCFSRASKEARDEKERSVIGRAVKTLTEKTQYLSLVDKWFDKKEKK